MFKTLIDLNSKLINVDVFMWIWLRRLSFVCVISPDVDNLKLQITELGED